MNLNKLTITEILTTYQFSPKFYVKYALACAELANSNIDKPMPESLECIRIVKLWLIDKATSEECRVAAYAAATYAAAYSAADYAAADAAYAAYNAAVNAAYNAVNAAYNATSTAIQANEKKCKHILLEIINDLSDLEKLMILKIELK